MNYELIEELLIIIMRHSNMLPLEVARQFHEHRSFDRLIDDLRQDEE